MKKYKLKELLTIHNGKDYKHLNDGQIPIYGTGGIMTYRDSYLYDGESILLPRKGSLSNIMYVNEKFWTVDTIYWTTVNNSLAYPKYLYCNLSLLNISCRDTGSTLPSMTFDSYYTLNIYLPKLSIQKLIGDFIFSFFHKIQLNTKIINELEAMAKLIYNYWFVQFDFPDENNRPYKSSGGAMIYNKDLKREIPVGWEVKTLNDCITTIIDKRGVTPKKLGGDWVKNGIIALSAKIVKNNKLIHLDEANQVSKEMFEKWMKEKLQDGDILMTSEAPLGEFYYLVGNTNYCLSQRLFAIRANPAIVTHSYLFNELSEGHGFSQIIGKQSGSTVFGIRQDELRKVLIVVPNLEIQKRFNKIVLPNYRLLRKLESENLKLIALRDYLLPLLMNGQVTITS